VNIAEMTPEQLAEHGIPLGTALRARVEERTERMTHLSNAQYWYAAGQQAAYEAVIAIIEAKGSV
jgi:hypothetical protein